MFAPGMERIAAGLVRERHHQQPARQRIARHDEHACGDGLEVLTRLLFGPRGAGGHGDLQEIVGSRVARDAPGGAGTFLQQNRLNLRLECLVIEHQPAAPVRSAEPVRTQAAIV